jgi:hypothetical protein
MLIYLLNHDKLKINNVFIYEILFLVYVIIENLCTTIKIFSMIQFLTNYYPKKHSTKSTKQSIEDIQLQYQHHPD